MRKKLSTIILFFGLIFSFSCAMPQTANGMTVTDLMNFAPNIGKLVAQVLGNAGVYGQLATTIKNIVSTKLADISVSTAKVAALLGVQAITQALIGDNGGSGVITDWNKYLYTSPQQKALIQMDSFFNTVSNGRLSSLNYEGVGPNYDAYLVAQARKTISGRAFSTTLQNITTDPSQLFATGNMKGLMTYMEPGNNVADYTLNSTAEYNSKLSKAQEIAKKEQSNGFLPKKSSLGKIIQPAAIVANAFTQIDQIGTQLILTAQPENGSSSGALMQIAKGAVISAAARNLNYLTANSEGKASIQNKNAQFPFSISYSSNSFNIGSTTSGTTTRKK